MTPTAENRSWLMDKSEEHRIALQQPPVSAMLVKNSTPAIERLDQT